MDIVQLSPWLADIKEMVKIFGFQEIQIYMEHY